MDPLAALISRCIVNPVTSEAIMSAGDFVLDQAVSSRRLRHPSWPDEETERFVAYWFDAAVVRDLATLASIIRSVHVNEDLRSFLWCAFSRMIIVKSNGVSQAMDLSHSRPHRVPSMRSVCPFTRFEREFQIVAERLAAFLQAIPSLPQGLALRSDARMLPLQSDSVDCVITSPPYLNAIDYIRMSKFTLIWLGHSIQDLRAIRSDLVGSEAGMSIELCADVPWRRFGKLDQLEKRYQRMIARYVYDVLQIAKEIFRVLKERGSYTVVIGNSAIRGVFVDNAEILKWAMSQAGLSTDSEERREIPDSRRYLPPPSTQLGRTSRMREEVVLAGSKT